MVRLGARKAMYVNNRLVDEFSKSDWADLAMVLLQELRGDTISDSDLHSRMEYEKKKIFKILVGQKRSYGNKT